MPCYDARDDWDSDLDRVGAGLLCELIKAGKVSPNDSEALAAWWEHHHNKDEYYRLKSEQRRA